MRTIKQIKEEIDDTKVFYNVAEVLSLISGLAFQEMSVKYKNDFTKLNKPLNIKSEKIIGGFQPNNEKVKKAAILIGSDLGYCGKFNNDIKKTFRKDDNLSCINNYNQFFLIGKKIHSLVKSEDNKKIFKKKFPNSKSFSTWNDLIDNKLKLIDEEIIEKFEDNNYMNESDEGFEVTVLSNKFLLKQNKGHIALSKFFYPKTQAVDYGGNESIQKQGFYETIDGKVILEPKANIFIFNFLKYYFKATFLDILIQSEIVENLNRMNSMNQAKDEIDNTLKKLKRELQKTRQVKITNELLEVIQSH